MFSHLSRAGVAAGRGDDAHVHGLRYEVNFESEVEGSDLIEANATEVREVFVNLIFNALDAMPRGGRIELRETRSDEWLVVEVRDTGEGIPPEFHDRIFEPFFTTKGSQGSGLGLAVSYGIIKRHGGTIEVASRPAADGSSSSDSDSAHGSGTVFTLKFPCPQKSAQ